MSRLRGEDGVAMIMATIMLFVLLGLGAALIMTTGGQQRSAANQTSSESAYSLAEAALNAQIFALAQQWPTKYDGPTTNAPNYGYPTSCNAASNGASYCPTTADLSTAYPTSGTCPAGTQGDAWNNSTPVSNGWTTYVRDAGASSSSQWSLFTDSAEQNAAAFDQAGAGSVWVRAVGIVNCHVAVVVTKVAEQVIATNFPTYVLDANNFTTGNSGNKDIINTQDLNGNKSPLSVRCSGSAYGNGAQPPSSACASDGGPQQIQPSTVYANPPAGTPTLSTAQLNQLKQLAIANGTYYGPGNCNFSNYSAVGASQGGISGSPVYVTGPCTISLSGGVQINGTPGASNDGCTATGSAPAYGFLILASGTMSMTGGSTFCGVIYAPNQSAISGPVVSLGGNSTVIGGLNVDGTASLSLGDSGNGSSCTDITQGNTKKCGDLEFALAAFLNISGFAGADPTPNSFRQLPATQ